jgi:glucose/mannose transport system permease protein
LYFTLFFILGTFVIGVLLAILLNRTSKLNQIFQTIFLFPMALSFVVTGTLWRWIFSPGNLPNNPYGINLLLEKIDLADWTWSWFISNSSRLGFNFALIAVIIAAIWRFSGYAMVIWLAGIEGIPRQVIEAARIDGASTWQLLTKILLPILKPLTISLAIILAHISLVHCMLQFTKAYL